MVMCLVRCVHAALAAMHNSKPARTTPTYLALFKTKVYVVMMCNNAIRLVHDVTSHQDVARLVLTGRTDAQRLAYMHQVRAICKRISSFEEQIR